MSKSATGNILRGLGVVAFLGLAGAGIYFFGLPLLNQHGTEVAAGGPGPGGGGPPPASIPRLSPTASKPSARWKPTSAPT
jgi:hypothetical protein